MKIQSLGGLESSCVTVIYADGEKSKLKRCPFSECDRHHVEGLEICDTTGKSIAEEAKRREEKARRQIVADRTKAKYEEEHLSGWKRRWRDVVFFFGVFGFSILAYNVSLASGLNDGYSIICGIATGFAWGWFWANKVNKYVKRMRARAKDIYQRVLNGEEVEV